MIPNPIPILQNNTKIEALYYGRDVWYPGVIGRDCGDGTYDVNYDDGEVEKNVKLSYIRSIGTSLPSRDDNTSIDISRDEESSSLPNNIIVMGRMTLVDLAGMNIVLHTLVLDFKYLNIVNRKREIKKYKSYRTCTSRNWFH
jgi:hypothetical protein